MKVDGSMRSLIQGVSQQPPRTRLPGQCTAQDNMSSNPVDGLTRRPPLDYIADLFTSASAQQFYYFDLGGGNQFVLAAASGSLKVFDLQGNEKTVTDNTTSFGYLDGGSLAITTLDNVTYIANRNTEVAMLADTADVVDYGSLVYLLGGQYSREYKVTVNWKEAGTGTERSVTVTHTTPDGSASAHGAQITTDYIADAIYDLLVAETTHSFNTTFAMELFGDVIYINWDDTRTDTFEVVCNDGEGGQHLVPVNNSVQNISKLPRYAPHGYHVTVTGTGGDGADDFYLVFQATPDQDGGTPNVGEGFGSSGTWVETVAAGIPYLLDTSTMPHTLTYDPDTDEFTFDEGDWKGRQVGDEDSNEDPSFVGRTIEDLGYFQGRLVALSGNAVIMSRTNRPTDFWIETATQQTDSDAIDIQSTAKGVSKMLRVIPHNRDLVVFADAAQFIVFGRNALTPANSSLVLTTSFEADLNADPVAAGRNIFFAIKYGQFAGIREFYTEGSQDINDSRPITQHVLNYIEGQATQMATTSNFDMLLVQASGDDTALYVYEYIWVNEQKAQSSWSRWLMPNPVVHFFFVESVIYIISKIGNDYVIESMDLDIHNDTGLTYQVKVDRKRTATAVNTDIVIDSTLDTDNLIFVQGENCPDPGMRVLVESYNAGTNTITLATDMDGGDVIYGEKYRSSYKPTMPRVKDQDGVEIGTGTLIVSKFLINCIESGRLGATISSLYADDVNLDFSGRLVGDPNSVVGEPALLDSTFIIPFRNNVEHGEIELYTDSHLPLTMMNIEWVGQYNKRGRRIVQGG